MLASQFVPSEPDSVQETGLSDSTLESLILKILYFRGDLYGQELEVAIGNRLRDEKKFASATELRGQIERDITMVRAAGPP